MPSIKSAHKRARVAGRKQLRNKSVRSQCKTGIDKAERLLFSGEIETAKQAVTAAVAYLDKATKKGVIHANNAARRKSRLMRKMNQAMATPPPVTEPEDAG